MFSSRQRNSLLSHTTNNGENSIRTIRENEKEKKTFRSIVDSSESNEIVVFSSDSKEKMQMCSINESIANGHVPTTQTFSIPKDQIKITTQTLTSPLTVGHNQNSPNSFSWLSRISNRFNTSNATVRTINKPSSTGLIFENRPHNLPPKSNEETLKHQNEYTKMCFEAKRAQQMLDEKEEQRQRLKLKREEFVSRSLQIWTHEILPKWEKCGSFQRCEDSALNSKAEKLWWHGLPPSKLSKITVLTNFIKHFESSNDDRFCSILIEIRGKIWKMSIGNELQLTYELFTQLEEIAREKLKATKEVRLKT